MRISPLYLSLLWCFDSDLNHVITAQSNDYQLRDPSRHIQPKFNIFMTLFGFKSFICLGAKLLYVLLIDIKLWLYYLAPPYLSNAVTMFVDIHCQNTRNSESTDLYMQYVQNNFANIPNVCFKLRPSSSMIGIFCPSVCPSVPPSVTPFCEARRASHCHSPQTTYSSKSTCCVLSAQKSGMHVIVCADRLSTQHSIVDSIKWSWSYWLIRYPSWHAECFCSALSLHSLAAHWILSASHTSVLPQHPRWEIVPHRVDWTHYTIDYHVSRVFSLTHDCIC